MRRICRLLALALAFALALASNLTLGCAYHVYSPPARAMPLETVATLPEAEHTLQLEGGGAGGVFGPSISTGAARVRRGLAPNLDGVAEASVLYVSDDSDTEASRNAYALRAGAKLRALSWLAFTAGAGVGVSALGGFFSPDLGLIIAYENRYFVPLLSARGFVSQPVTRHRVYLGDDDGTPRFGAPLVTRGGAVTLGARIPLQHSVAVPDSLLFGVTATKVFDREQSQGVIGPSFGLELHL